jgi:hypothetical protein
MVGEARRKSPTRLLPHVGLDILTMRYALGSRRQRLRVQEDVLEIVIKAGVRRLCISDRYANRSDREYHRDEKQHG